MKLTPEAAIKPPIAGPTDGRRNLEGEPRDGANQPAPSPGKARPYGSLSRLVLLVICITALPLGCLLAWPRTRWGANAPEAPVVEPLDPPRATLSRPSFANSRVQAAALEPAPAPSTSREVEVVAREGEQDETAAAGDEAAITPGDKDALTDLAS